MKKLIAGNWKMNGTLDSVRSLTRDVVNGIDANPALLDRCDFVLFPSFVHISPLRHILQNYPFVAYGAQDCAAGENGAFTGDVSVAMLKDGGCTHVILGHSERREHHGESDETVSKKAALAHAHGLVAIICVGEKGHEREKGAERDVVARQLAACLPKGASGKNTVIAYEPVWAIGTGKNATPHDAASMHGFIRESLKNSLAEFEKLRILYGGSMKPGNARDLLGAPDVDGGLIGGASLSAKDFLAIALAA